MTDFQIHIILKLPYTVGLSGLCCVKPVDGGEHTDTGLVGNRWRAAAESSLLSLSSYCMQIFTDKQKYQHHMAQW